MDYRVTLVDDSEIILGDITCVHIGTYGFSFYCEGTERAFVSHGHMKLYEVVNGSLDSKGD